MASTQWSVLIFFSVITLHIAFYDALNAYAFLSTKESRRVKEIKEFAYELLHTFYTSGWHMGSLWEKVQKWKGRMAIYDMRTNVQTALDRNVHRDA